MEKKFGRDTHPILHDAVQAAHVVHEGTLGIAPVPTGEQRAQHEADRVDVLDARTAP